MAAQQLLQQQYNRQRAMLLENQEKALKTHFLDYLEQHKRLDELKANQVNLNSNRMTILHLIYNPQDFFVCVFIIFIT